jgi:thiol-disulfide isomerase/thioredoxin
VRQPPLLLLLTFILPALQAAKENPAAQLWNDLKVKREALPGYHQEFSVSRSIQSARTTQGSKRQLVVDAAGRTWKQRSVSGSGDRVEIFDGMSAYRMEEGGDEYVLVKLHAKEEPLPEPYKIDELDWGRAKETARRPCEVAQAGHTCVVLAVPAKPVQLPSNGSSPLKVLEGVEEISLDLENGLLIGARSLLVLDNGRSRYQSSTIYTLKHLNYGAAPDAALFKLPEGSQEVKVLSKWTISRIRKELIARPAPELAVTAMDGAPLTLSSLKGKTVLLDFWATWCGPCRVDAPALDKLYRKYGSKDLEIIGISVSEDRGIVEKYLKEHPHNFPIVLSTENELPRAFQVSAFPTYILIDPDGKVSSAAQGDQGFGELRKLLKQAGLELD